MADVDAPEKGSPGEQRASHAGNGAGGQRTLPRSKALKTAGPARRGATCNVKRATVDGDVGTAVEAGKALEGKGTGGDARGTDSLSGLARKHGEPHGWLQDATSL